MVFSAAIDNVFCLLRCFWSFAYRQVWYGRNHLPIFVNNWLVYFQFFLWWSDEGDSFNSSGRRVTQASFFSKDSSSFGFCIGGRNTFLNDVVDSCFGVFFKMVAFTRNIHGAFATFVFATSSCPTSSCNSWSQSSFINNECFL